MEKQKGLAIHRSHDKLLDYCEDFQKRQEQIKKNKPENERETRLRLLKLLPKEAIADLPINLQKASAMWEKTDIEWEKAEAQRDKAEADA